jgi:hypothetical protein
MLQRSVTNVSSVFLGRMLQVCLPGFCICFTQMLQVFYLDVAYIYNDFSSFLRGFFQVFQKHVSSVLSIFFCKLYLNILKVDRASLVSHHLVGVDQTFDEVSRLHGG